LGRDEDRSKGRQKYHRRAASLSGVAVAGAARKAFGLARKLKSLARKASGFGRKAKNLARKLFWLARKV